MSMTAFLLFALTAADGLPHPAQLQLGTGLTEWIQSLSALQALLGVTGLALLTGSWRYVLKPTIGFVRQFNAGNKKLAALDPAQLETCVRELATVKEDVAKVRALLGPNGGTSLYDKVTMAGKSALLSQARLSTMFDIVVDRPMFETDAAGQFTSVNAAFEKSFDTSCDDMYGRGWINLLIPEDREPFVRAWHHAIADRRAFRSVARCVTQRTGFMRTGMCSWSMQPILEPSTDNVLAWMGAVEIPMSFLLPATGADTVAASAHGRTAGFG
jgi:PAS domain S-box-containing protein